MLQQRRLLIAAALAAGLLIAGKSRAQIGSAGANGVGYAGPQGAFSTFEQMENAGPSRTKKDDSEVIKEAKRKITDADPRVRVDGVDKLRYVSDSADAHELLFRALSDRDVRVRVKAIDVLGARGTTDAVPVMAQDLFLRETPAIEKLHLVAALGRVGDSRGTLPIIEYLDETEDAPSRGTAVFALGEIGDPRANDKLIQIVRGEDTAMVRKLAEEAIEKIDGELPNRHQEVLAAEKSRSRIPTDQKLAKLRQYDAEVQAEKEGKVLH